MSAERRWQGARWRRGFALALFFLVPIARPLAASDPGVRGGTPDSGSPLRGLTVEQLQFFDVALDEFTEIQSVQGEAFFPNTEAGLGPRFNLNSCAGCHAQPAVGGTSPAVN